MVDSLIGIESTAHTFSASVVTSSGRILSDVRDVYRAPAGGGIHPIEASSQHMANAPGVLREALLEAGIPIKSIRAVSYSMGPGLGPCLRVGAVAARSLAATLVKRIVPVNHAIGHIELGCLLTRTKDPLVLLVSGGHSMVVAFSGNRWRILGESLDLTLGQLIDQFGRHAGLASPCGTKVEEAASKSAKYIELPYTVKGNDVSYSGILTAAKNLLDRGVAFEDVCFSLQETAFAMIVEVTERALAFTEKKEVMVVGGVAANLRLSEMLKTMVRRHSASFRAVPPRYSGDCGAQIAWAGWLEYNTGNSIAIVDATTRQSWRLDSVDAKWRDARRS
ncbi:MAG: KEOPS complex N(6)-L-threonylcarbamoyladenine synthase Kae1 [Thaumarchaeota archaeon]|nr:KEOPS complex N(6)-L-threonylcarbamoyladenine synthase Kae1 [Nitrososphaerota archaeon]